jgi:hypothetical protein
MRLRSSVAGPRVRITLGGKGLTAGGHTASPSISTVYGVLEPGASPVTGTRA